MHLRSTTEPDDAGIKKQAYSDFYTRLIKFKNPGATPELDTTSAKTNSVTFGQYRISVSVFVCGALETYLTYLITAHKKSE